MPRSTSVHLRRGLAAVTLTGIAVAACSLVPRVEYTDTAIDPTSLDCDGFAVSAEPGDQGFATSEAAALDWLTNESRGVGIAGPADGSVWAIMDRMGSPIGYVITQRFDGVEEWHVELAFECT